MHLAPAEHPRAGVAEVCSAARKRGRNGARGGFVLLSVESSRSGSADAAWARSGAPVFPTLVRNLYTSPKPEFRNRLESSCRFPQGSAELLMEGETGRRTWQPVLSML